MPATPRGTRSRSSTIAEAMRAPIEYRPTSLASASLRMKNRSPKFSSQSASIEGTSGSPKRFIRRRSGRSSVSPSCSRRYDEQRRVHDERAGEVADDDAGRSPVEDDDEEDRRRDGDDEVDEGRGDERDRAAPRRGRGSSSARSSFAPRAGRRRPARASSGRRCRRAIPRSARRARGRRRGRSSPSSS